MPNYRVTRTQSVIVDAPNDKDALEAAMHSINWQYTSDWKVEEIKDNGGSIGHRHNEGTRL
jgi:hypothetical protein